MITSEHIPLKKQKEFDKLEEQKLHMINYVSETNLLSFLCSFERMECDKLIAVKILLYFTVFACNSSQMIMIVPHKEHY